MRVYSMRNNNQILHDDQTGCEENLTGSTTKADAQSVRDTFLFKLNLYSVYVHSFIQQQKANML